MEKKRILIIDDEENFTLLVKLNLEESGKYEVRRENKGSLGLIAAKEFKPNLILLDILMPDIEGSEVAAQLKEDPNTKDIPVIFLTAVLRQKDLAHQGSVMGGHPFIAKPVSIEQLLVVVEQNIS